MGGWISRVGIIRVLIAKGRVTLSRHRRVLGRVLMEWLSMKNNSRKGGIPRKPQGTGRPSRVRELCLVETADMCERNRETAKSENSKFQTTWREREREWGGMVQGVVMVVGGQREWGVWTGLIDDRSLWTLRSMSLMAGNRSCQRTRNCWIAGLWLELGPLGYHLCVFHVNKHCPPFLLTIVLVAAHTKESFGKPHLDLAF